MKNKKWLILIITGIIFIILALCLLMYNAYADNRAGKKSQEALEKIQESLKDINKNEQSEDSSKEKILNIDGNDYIGIIEIPVLNLELPVMSEVDDDNLKISPCRYSGTIETNDLVICAHSYKKLFRYIKNLNQGDIVILTDMNGKEHLYQVELTEILAPTDIKEMIESDFDLTLYTCTNDNLNRITIRLNRFES